MIAALNVIGIGSLFIAFAVSVWGLAPPPVNKDELLATIIGVAHLNNPDGPWPGDLPMIRGGGFDDDEVEVNISRRTAKVTLKRSDLSTENFLVEENEYGEIVNVVKLIKVGWRKLTKEQRKEYNHLIFLKHKKKWRDWYRAYYASHKEVIKARQRARYKETHPPKKRGRPAKSTETNWDNRTKKQEIISQEQSPQEEFEENELFEVIRKYLTTLSTRDKEIADRIIEGAKDKDISNAYQVDVEHVENVRENLKEVIEKAGY